MADEAGVKHEAVQVPLRFLHLSNLYLPNNTNLEMAIRKGALQNSQDGRLNPDIIF